MALKDTFLVQLTPARILLKADTVGPDHWPDGRIADALDCGTATVARVRQQEVQ